MHVERCLLAVAVDRCEAPKHTCMALPGRITAPWLRCRVAPLLQQQPLKAPDDAQQAQEDQSLQSGRTSANHFRRSGSAPRPSGSQPKSPGSEPSRCAGGVDPLHTITRALRPAGKQALAVVRTHLSHCISSIAATGAAEMLPGATKNSQSKAGRVRAFGQASIGVGRWPQWGHDSREPQGPRCLRHNGCPSSWAPQASWCCDRGRERAAAKNRAGQGGHPAERQPPVPRVLSTNRSNTAKDKTQLVLGTSSERFGRVTRTKAQGYIVSEADIVECSQARCPSHSPAYQGWRLS